MRDGGDGEIRCDGVVGREFVDGLAVLACEAPHSMSSRGQNLLVSYPFRSYLHLERVEYGPSEVRTIGFQERVVQKSRMRHTGVEVGEAPFFGPAPGQPKQSSLLEAVSIALILLSPLSHYHVSSLLSC